MNFKRILKNYMPFAVNVFKKNLSYKADVVMFLLGHFMLVAVNYYLWKAVYASSSSSNLMGFSSSEMSVYIFMSFIVSIVIHADISYTVMSEVKDGSIAINLIRPISYELRMFFESLGSVMYNFLLIFIVGFIVITLFACSNGVEISAIGIGAFIFSIVVSCLINFYFSYCFGLLSFKLTNMWGINQIMNAIISLLSGSLIPIVFFPEWSQKLFNLLPFSSMIYTPTMIYLGKLNGIEVIYALVIQIVWVVILALIAKAMWKSLVKHLVILGG